MGTFLSILNFLKSLFSFLTPIISYFVGRKKGLEIAEKENLKNNEKLRKKMDKVPDATERDTIDSLRDGDF